MKVARMAADELNAIRARLEGQERGGTAVHYTFAGAAGAAYAASIEYAGWCGIWAGLLYATALWFGADFIVLPATGLSRSGAKYGWRVEAVSLAGHLAYGMVLEISRASLIRMIELH